MSRGTGRLGRPKTKIVCTLGPSTESPEQIKRLIECGMSVARLNFSHGTFESHSIAVERIREASKVTGIPVGIMVDVPGSKYRTGPLAPGAVQLMAGEDLTLTSEDIIGTEKRVGVSPPGIHRDAVVGHPVLLDDGLVALECVAIHDQDVDCVVVSGGRLTERRGVAVPGRSPSQPFPDKRTKDALAFASDNDVDFVALSMVTKGSSITSAKEILAERGSVPSIISKIELAEAIENFDDILEQTDAVMVARGDMGVEVPLSRVPVIQKDLIARCNAAGKPVITATQMLESMVSSKIPTRAEVTDVANAVFDGTDAIMLSGETSVGANPIEAVLVMARVAFEAEDALPYENILRDKAPQLEHQTDDAISYDACRTAHQLGASLIVSFTESGGTPGRVSKYRPMPPILALTQGTAVQRLLTLTWGVTPVVIERLETVDDFFTRGEEEAVKTAGVASGDLIVLVAGLPIGVRGGTNLLRVMTVS